MLLGTGSLLPRSGHRRFRGRAVPCSVDSPLVLLLFSLSLICEVHLGAATPVQATGCSLIGNCIWVSIHVPHSTLDWAQIGHRCGPRAFEVWHTSRFAEPHSQQKARSIRRRSWDNRATRQVTMSSPLAQTDGEYNRQNTEKTDGSLFTIAHVGKLMRKMRSKSW